MSATPEAAAKRGRGGDADSMARAREVKRIKRAAKRARADARRRRERPVTVPRPVCATAQHRARLARDGFVCVPLVPLSSLKDAAGETYTATKWTALAARIAALPELTIFQTADVGADGLEAESGDGKRFNLLVPGPSTSVGEWRGFKDHYRRIVARREEVPARQRSERLAAITVLRGRRHYHGAAGAAHPAVARRADG